MTLSLEQLTAGFSRLLPPPPAAAAPIPPVIVPDAAGSPAPVPPVLSPPAAPAYYVQPMNFAARGFHLDASLPPDQVVAAARLMDEHGFGLDAVTGMDWIAQEQMEVVYDYFHPESALRIVVRARLPRSNPEIQTISAVFPGANWHERETHEFFGIKFLNHPNLIPLLLPEDADFHPLRKDFKS